jgi:hypothetical protein
MPSLISTEIHQVTAAPVVVRDVPVANRSGATYALADRRKWVRKKKLAIGEYGMLAEAIGWLWARKLELPVPDAAAFVPGQYEVDCWLSEAVDDVRHWRADKVPVVNSPGLGGILALDAVLMNDDRHEGNILLEPFVEDGEEAWRAWGIDFGNAKVGLVEEFIGLEEALPAVDLLPKDLPFEILEGPALEAAEEIAAWEDLFITKSVGEACSVAGSGQADILVQALIKRCDKAVPLVEAYFEELLETT